MAKCGKDIVLTREGTDQQQRFIDALHPDFVKLNDFGIEEWMRFAYSFASNINYFSSTNPEVPSDNWRSFFKSKEELEDFLNEIEKGKTITPHLALFVVFIKLLEITQKRFNKLTKRHLDFYYGKILNIQKLPPSADKVHVIFELAKNTVEKIDKNTALEGGKDPDGNKLIYKTKEELVANQTRVNKLKSFYRDQVNHKLKVADVANSYDGKGAEFPDKDIKWWPFGYYEEPPLTDEADHREYGELEYAKIGFALSGEILELKEGERNIQITVQLNKALSKSYSDVDLKTNIQVYCTGEKGWLGSFDAVKEPGDTNFISGTVSGNRKVLKIAFQIPKEEKAIVKYDPKIHGGNYNAKYPVCKVLFKTENPDAVKLYNDLSGKEVSEVKINVAVKDVVGLNLHNDQGAINIKKPFYPFGTQPVKKSKFYIEYDELYKKKWDDLTIDIEWKNTPDDFKQWYFAYRRPQNYRVSSMNYLTGIFKVIDLDAASKTSGGAIKKGFSGGKTSGVGGFSVLPENYKLEEKSQLDNLYVDNNSYFKVTVERNEKEEWEAYDNQKNVTLFTKDSDGIFRLNLTVPNSAVQKEDVGSIRLSLNQPFLHSMYPRLYALAMTSEDKNVIIPNEPYTPFVEEIKLAYKATASVLVNSDSSILKDYETEDFGLFHLHPFGQARESITLKKNNGILKSTEQGKLNIVSSHSHGGELFIGLENAKNQQIISLLVQVLEGSEKPDLSTVSGTQGVEWWILCNNEWRKLSSTDILNDETESFLKSGIFRFTMPQEATSANTLLPSGYFWLRATMTKDFNLFSKVKGIHAQAVEAGFSNKNNNLQHLINGLPADTISKMVNRLPKVKGVSQPYNSFGGQAAETNDAYYRRISERLRHKDRAITIWDYEHILLQQFPEIYKVKCLNHTKPVSGNDQKIPTFLAPGHVSLVVIPDIVNKNVFDIYKPAVSMAKLKSIQNYLRELSSSLIELHVINPVYEEVKVQLNVKFKSGYDNNYYKTVLSNDITKLLSPWAFNRKAGIQFGLTFHKSVLIKYVEDLGYVDFVSDVKLFQLTANSANKSGDEVPVATPSNPLAILVSSKGHDISINDSNCLT